MKGFKSMKVDIHAHMLVPEILADRGPEKWRPEMVSHPSGGYLVRNSSFVNGPAFKRIVEADQIEKSVLESGVDLTVLSTPPYAFYYELPATEGERASSIQNDGLARAVKDHSKHLAGLGTLPMQDVPMAVKELKRVMIDLKLSGVELSSNVNGEDLGSEKYRPFWEAAESLGAVVFIHPAFFQQLGTDRMNSYYLKNLLGNPMETTVFAAHMIFSGMMEDYPKLKIVLAHAGGVLPYLRGRLEHGYEVRSEPKKVISKPPSAYLGMFYYDIITHYAPTLQYLIDLVGADHVMLGTDYPFDMGIDDPVQVVEQLPGISPAERDLIMGGNALRLLENSLK
jgi:aminocarboxymuconate-semialdehyde decarboxylase